MSNSKENLWKTLNHKEPDRLVVDFGATTVTGIHVKVVEQLREHFGLERKPVKVVEPFQMLGEIDNDLIQALGVDAVGIFPERDMFNVSLSKSWKPFTTLWDQVVLLPEDFNCTKDDNGDFLMYPGGNTSLKPSGRMPKTGYFFDAIERQGIIDDSIMRPEDSIEEFGYIDQNDIDYWKRQTESILDSQKGAVATFGGTALGDVAMVPGIGLACPKGIRSVTEWYLSTVMRESYISKMFDIQTDIAIENLNMINDAVGTKIDVVFICGTDFGTQNSTFCSSETYIKLWMPYYKKVNDWIHKNTGWKTFKHSCGAIASFIPYFIESGFDIINPVQINASGMDSEMLKNEYGKDIVFWGGGVDTQGVFAFGKPEDVKDQVRKQCDIFGKDGGFVFNTVHNIQANVPFENIVAMFEALDEYKKAK
jgi:hypothetical protein